MQEFLTATIGWLQEHPHWAGIVVFAINVSESLVVIGLFVPGTVVMFGIGALVSLGAMGLGSTLAWAIAGALVGDGVSYVIGRRYREKLRIMWPFRRHPEWLSRAEGFFEKHGAKSVIFGRFAGPVRPIIPAVAGMMGMSAVRFYWANFLSAITWAPAYIFPGVVFGASMSLASKVATRLMIVLVLLLVLSWLTVVLVRRVYLFLQPKTQRIVLYLLAWSRAHPFFEGMTLSVLDPNSPEIKGLVELGVLLLIGSWVFFAVLLGELWHPQPLSLDYQVYYLLQGLRTAWADQGMVLISELADSLVNVAVAGVGLTWLAFQRHWLAASHWAAALALAVLVGFGLNYFLPGAIPRQEISAWEMRDVFPSTHALVVTTLYGFLAVLIAREVSPTWRRLPYMMVAVWILLVVISHLYLGRRWLSDIAGGVALGIAWSGFVGIAYRRRASTPIRFWKLLGVLVLALLTVGSGYVYTQHLEQIQKYEVRHTERALNLNSWWTKEWQSLAPYRVDWGGSTTAPMTLQVAGNLEGLVKHLREHGWQVADPPTAAGFLRFFVPNSDPSDLPLLPLAHDGRQEVVRLVQSGRNSSRLVLRFWQSGVYLMPGHIPLWIGNVARQQLAEPLGLATILKTELNYDAPLALLRPALVDFSWYEVRRSTPQGWRGTVFLIQVL